MNCDSFFSITGGFDNIFQLLYIEKQCHAFSVTLSTWSTRRNAGLSRTLSSHWNMNCFDPYDGLTFKNCSTGNMPFSALSANARTMTNMTGSRNMSSGSSSPCGYYML